MNKIHSKTLQDLEFSTVLEHITDRCSTELGKATALGLKPFVDKDQMMAALLQTSEYLSSFDNNNRIPNHGFESISQEIKLLAIEDSLIELSGFRKINSISNTVNTHILFLKNFMSIT